AGAPPKVHPTNWVAASRPRTRPAPRPASRTATLTQRFRSPRQRQAQSKPNKLDRRNGVLRSGLATLVPNVLRTVVKLVPQMRIQAGALRLLAVLEPPGRTSISSPRRSMRTFGYRNPKAQGSRSQVSTVKGPAPAYAGRPGLTIAMVSS